MRARPDLRQRERGGADELVVKEYPGTPWATRATYEMSRGWGIDLVPDYHNPNPPPGGKVPVKPIVTPKI